MSGQWSGPLEQVTPYSWRIPKSYRDGMRVPGLIYISEELIESLRKDQAPEQVANVAFLPGIQRNSYAMPDIHWGYGFPIGGVAATDVEEGGVVSPGGVGYDINCGVRLVRTNLSRQEINDKIERLTNGLFAGIPAGVGARGKISLSASEERRLMAEGVKWIVERGYGRPEDIDRCEAGGRIPGADPEVVSKRALERGHDQVGTLGSGNHFVEIEEVDEVYDPEVAEAFSIFKGQVVVLVHSGSRGLGHQVCDDALRALLHTPEKYGIALPDRQLVCAPVKSPEGQRYMAGMAGAANFAWANRQILMHLVRQIFEKVLSASPRQLGMDLVYDVAHNIAKIEEHEVNGKRARLCVHRKGATRAFPAGHPEVPAVYKRVGQPIVIPGDMGTNSYLLVGTEKAMREAFGSTCHGAGRVMSRHEAIRQGRGRGLVEELKAKGIIARAPGWQSLAEEASYAYKNVTQVVETVHQAGLSKKVARMRPLGVIKG